MPDQLPQPSHVVYLAHPLSAATREGIESNRASGAKWAAWISQAFGVAVSADWLWMTGELEETPRNREWGLLCDLKQIERCDALFIVGHELSSGMRREAAYARSLGIPVFSLVGLPMDAELIAAEIRRQGWPKDTENAQARVRKLETAIRSLIQLLEADPHGMVDNDDLAQDLQELLPDGT